MTDATHPSLAKQALTRIDEAGACEASDSARSADAKHLRATRSVAQYATKTYFTFLQSDSSIAEAMRVSIGVLSDEKSGTNTFATVDEDT